MSCLCPWISVFAGTYEDRSILKQKVGMWSIHPPDSWNHTNKPVITDRYIYIYKERENWLSCVFTPTTLVWEWAGASQQTGTRHSMQSINQSNHHFSKTEEKKKAQSYGKVLCISTTAFSFSLYQLRYFTPKLVDTYAVFTISSPPFSPLLSVYLVPSPSSQSRQLIWTFFSFSVSFCVPQNLYPNAPAK